MSFAGFDRGDGSSIADGVELGHGTFGEVAAVGHLPFMMEVVEDRADEADDAGLVGAPLSSSGGWFSRDRHRLE